MQPAARTRRTTWLATALVCAAMLLLPALVWLLAPRPASFARLPRPVATAAAAAGEEAPPPRRSPPSVAPATAAPVASAEPGEDRVVGRVLDGTGQPVAGAFVACDDGRPVPGVRTDARGRFELPAAAAGCSAVSTHPSFYESSAITLSADGPNVLVLRSDGAIEGEVVDERGQPVPSYQLAMESYQGPSGDTPTGAMRDIRDERGAFRWDHLAPGTYVLGAVGPGRPIARSRSIDVEMGRTTHHVRIVLTRGATLTGRVLDADTRKPIAGAHVAFDALSSALVEGAATSEEGGAFSLPGAPPGPFSIRVSREGYITKTVPGLLTRGADTLRHDVELRPYVEGGPRDELAGVGALLAPTPRGVAFGKVFGGLPAAAAGVRDGDRILRIDGADASGMTVSDAIQHMRGPAGSIVSVQLDRDGKTVDVNIVRAVIPR